MNRSCSTLAELPEILLSSIPLNSSTNPSSESPRCGSRTVSSKACRLTCLLQIVSFVVEPLSSAFSSSL